MSTQESDGIDDALQGVTHVAMTAAARMGEQLARMREQQAREAQARSEQAAREHAERLNAEREAARASLAPVHRPEWWDTAQAEDVTKAYQTAKAWSDIDPEAVRAEQRIVEEVRTRFGVDVARDGDPSSVNEAIERAEKARAEAAEQRTAAGGDRAEAVGLIARADATDRAAEGDLRDRLSPESREVVDEMRERRGVDGLDPDADPEDANRAAELAAPVDSEAEQGRTGEMREHAGRAYDSAERREAMAQGLDHIENRAAVDARVHSDVAQGRPATDAVAHLPGRAPEARKTKGSPQTARKVQRTGQSR